METLSLVGIALGFIIYVIVIGNVVLPRRADDPNADLLRKVFVVLFGFGLFMAILAALAWAHQQGLF